jgi:hypothetical protein
MSVRWWGRRGLAPATVREALRDESDAMTGQTGDDTAPETGWITPNA